MLRIFHIMLSACLLILLPPILASDEKSMEAWWVDLEKGDVEATRALLNLSDHPSETIAFLKKTMKPLTVSSGQVKALLLKRGNANEAVWKPAFEELEYLDPRLAIDLKILMDRYKESPTRQRMVEVMSGRVAGQLAGKEIELWNAGDGFNFFAKPNFRLMVGRTPHRAHQLGFVAKYQEEVDPRRPRHRITGAYRYSRCHGHPQGHGDRPSRRPADQGGEGVAEAPGEPVAGPWRGGPSPSVRDHGPTRMSARDGESSHVRHRRTHFSHRPIRSIP